MNIVLDTHTHTIASGHAYSTISEMVTAAKEKNLELLAITEHAMNMPGTCHEFYFHNLRVIPRNLQGVQLLFGTEANIVDYEGHLDMNEDVLKQMDLVIASLHGPCIDAGTKEENTSAIIGAMKNPYVNIIGHPDDGRFPIDYEMMVQAAKEYRVCIELNNSSLNPNGFRSNTHANALIYLELCKQYEVPITLGSDAHIHYDVANYCYAMELIKEVEFPEHLIMNTNKERFLQFIQDKKSLL